MINILNILLFLKGAYKLLTRQLSFEVLIGRVFLSSPTSAGLILLLKNLRWWDSKANFEVLLEVSWCPSYKIRLIVGSLTYCNGSANTVRITVFCWMKAALQCPKGPRPAGRLMALFCCMATLSKCVQV